MAIQYRRWLGSGGSVNPTSAFEIGVVSTVSGYTSCSILVAVIQVQTGGTLLPTVSDTQGNVYTLDDSLTIDTFSGSPATAYLFSSHNAKVLGAADSIQITGGFVQVLASAEEFTGLDGTLDGDALASDTTGNSAAAAGGSYTTTVNGDLVFGAVFAYEQNFVPMPPVSVAPGGADVQTGGGTRTSLGATHELALSCQYQVQPAAAAVNQTATLSIPAQWVVLSQAYKAAAGGGGGLKGTAVGVGLATGAIRKPGLSGTAVGVGLARGAIAVPGLKGTAIGVGLATGALAGTGSGFDFTGSNGLFTRLGLIGGIIYRVNLHRGGDIPSRVLLLDQAYTVRDDLSDGVFSALASYQGQARTYLRSLQTVAKNTVIQMANDVTPLADLTIQAGLDELIAEMKAKGQTVKRAVCTATWQADAANDGNAVLVLSTKDRYGVAYENLFQEAITLAVTSDAQGGGAAGNEGLTATSPIAQPDTLSYDWPAGSGISVGLTAADETTSGSLLTDGGFEKWTLVAPLQTLTSWTKETGTYGGQAGDGTINQGFTANGFLPYKGAYTLRFKGNTAGELTSIYQRLPAGTLQPLRQYAINCWVKCPTGSGPSSVLQLALASAPGGGVTADESGTANAVNTIIPGVGMSNWLQVQGTFRTPRRLTGTETLYVRMTGALLNAVNLLVDGLCLTEMTQLYPSGPSVSVFAGSAALIAADVYTVTVGNDRGGQPAGKSWNSLFDRLFNMRQLERQLPSAASPTIPDGSII